MHKFFHLQADLDALEDWPLKLELFISKVPSGLPFSEKYQRDACNAALARVKALANYKIDTTPKINAPLTLVRPEVSMVLNCKEDYELSQFTTQSVPVTILEGNHFTILDNPSLIKIIHKHFIYQ